MIWYDDDDELGPGMDSTPPMVDLAFKLAPGALALDHAHALGEAVTDALPWMATDVLAGVHRIHVSTAGNGWQRASAEDASKFAVSKRMRMLLRVGPDRVADARVLSGQTLMVGGDDLRIGDAKVRKLVPTPTLIARHVLLLPSERDVEEQFSERVEAALRDKEIVAPRMLCGLAHTFQTPNGVFHTRSVMLDGLSHKCSLRAQVIGVGEGRRFGCGLFVAHKGIGQMR